MAVLKPPKRLTNPEDLAEAHRQLMPIVDRLESATDPDEVGEAADALEALLRGHFARESCPEGVFDWLVMLDPRMRAQVDRLEAEHGELLRMLAAVRGGADPADFIALLRDHERREWEAVGRARNGVD